MSTRQLTPEEAAFVAQIEREYQCMVGDGAPQTGATLREAVEAAYQAITDSRFRPEIKVERDPNDPNRLTFTMPLAMLNSRGRELLHDLEKAGEVQP